MGRLRNRLVGPREDADFLAAIAAQIAEHRLLRGLSQQELAELCGTSQPGIARLERGASPPRVDTLLRVADALDCELVVQFRARPRPKGGRR
jgi:transcriptional regulator with XRE-family HTH domain